MERIAQTGHPIHPAMLSTQSHGEELPPRRRNFAYIARTPLELRYCTWNWTEATRKLERIRQFSGEMSPKSLQPPPPVISVPLPSVLKGIQEQLVASPSELGAPFVMTSDLALPGHSKYALDRAKQRGPKEEVFRVQPLEKVDYHPPHSGGQDMPDIMIQPLRIKKDQKSDMMSPTKVESPKALSKQDSSISKPSAFHEPLSQYTNRAASSARTARNTHRVAMRRAADVVKPLPMPMDRRKSRCEFNLGDMEALRLRAQMAPQAASPEEEGPPRRYMPADSEGGRFKMPDADEFYAIFTRNRNPSAVRNAPAPALLLVKARLVSDGTGKQPAVSVPSRAGPATSLATTCDVPFPAGHIDDSTPGQQRGGISTDKDGAHFFVGAAEAKKEEEGDVSGELEEEEGDELASRILLWVFVSGTGIAAGCILCVVFFLVYAFSSLV